MLFFSFGFLISSESQDLTPSMRRVTSGDHSPYLSVGLVKAYFSCLKLKRKDHNDFLYADVGSNFYLKGSGFLLQPGVVATAAHMVMPSNFDIQQGWFRNYVDFKNCEQLPYKVEFFPFYPHNNTAPMTRTIGQDLILMKRAQEFSPKSGETIEEINHKQEQECAEKYFVVSEEWKKNLQKKDIQSFHDYAVLLFREQTTESTVTPVQILREFNKIGEAIAVVGYPSCFYNHHTDSLEENEVRNQLELFGKVVYTIESQICHSCQAYSGVSGGPIIEKLSNRVIGLHVSSVENTDGTRGQRHGIRFTSSVISFIQSSLKKRGGTSTLTIFEENASGSQSASSGVQTTNATTLSAASLHSTNREPLPEDKEAKVFSTEETANILAASPFREPEPKDRCSICSCCLIA